MKRLTLAASLLALSLSLPAYAADSAAGGLEFSGNISVLTGWQHDDNASLGNTGGQLPGIRGARSANRDTFGFYLDQFELDIDKSFGERIRLRADLDFGRALSGSTANTGGSNFVVEQAYVTVGILGGELAVGRFNAPVGYYVVDRAYNPTISFSNTYNALPTNVTGAKMYWAFNDHIDLSVYLMNNMFDCVQIGGTCLTSPAGGVIPGTGDSAIPSWGMRLGFNWGEEDTASTVGLSYLGGPEQGVNAHLDHLLDLDFAIKFSENLLLAGDVMYQQRNNLAGVAGPNSKLFAGVLVLDWQASEVWDLFFSYGYIHDIQGTFTGFDMQDHNFLAGFGYQITDDAKFKMEYRMDLFNYATSTVAVGADRSSISHGLAAEFAYTF